ncbi:phosphotransferase [Streptomyces sp. NPDC047315]|uniref:phosphotransferase n=1 Tax=Streptomyces sp. NPDC047315 TaxID=3155142 RepID=UPI0033D742A9
MKDQPDGIDESDVRAALAAWEIDAADLAYAPVGFGDYHWTAKDTTGGRWFVTLSDLTDKNHCGIGADAAWQGLRRAMDTAVRLKDRDGLGFEDGGFVLAPLSTADGRSVRRLGERYALSVFPYASGSSGDFGQRLAPSERARTLETLAALHAVHPPAVTRVIPPQLSARERLEENLAAVAGPWSGGPWSEPAREATIRHAAGLRRRLDEFDALRAEVSGRGAALVVTHGEPHPGNLLWHRGRQLLLDWDTVGLAVPERDLWLVADGPDDLARYEELTGRAPDPSALALYRLRWDLEDVDAFLGWFRSPHAATPDLEQAWDGFLDTVRRLAA